MRFIVMGPPGSGKGVQAPMLSHQFGAPYLSTGQVFRDLQHEATELANVVRNAMQQGEYVDDEVTNSVVASYLARADCAEGFVLDGYPRTLAQARFLDGFLSRTGVRLDGVVSLEVDSAELVRRLSSRAGIERRSDDDPNTVRRRLAIYSDRTAPLLAYYRDRGILVEVNAVGSIDAVGERIRTAIIDLESRSV